MTKSWAIAITAVLGLSGAAAPVTGVQASPMPGMASCSLTPDLSSPLPWVVQQALDDARRALRRQGVDTDRVEIWGGCLRAYVRLADGRVVNRFFDPWSLRPVEYGNAGISN